MGKQHIKKVAETFGIAQLTAKKYIRMTKEEISDLDNPKNYKKRESTMNVWLNVIYKMMQDDCSNETIYFYIKQQQEFHDTDKKLADYIYTIGKNNFPNRTPFNSKTTMEWVFPPEVIIISRTDLLKYILTCNPKTKKDTTIEKYIDIIKNKYPIIENVETMFKEFHALLMGKDEKKLDEYLEKYEESKIQSFCNGIKKDITPVKNAIFLSVSSGFVEGNNNKFKVLKRIVYGRSGLVNLEKKCKLAFLAKQQDFSLSTLL
ncbi:MAG: transposase [Hespellia sp.]|nr:transposase [Hespellia sp.]